MPQNPGNYIPAPHPVVEDKTRLITRPWMLYFQQVIDGLIAAGNIFGPALGGSTDNAIVRWDGLTGKVLQNSVVPLADDGTFSFPDGIRQTFNPNATNSGFNVGAQAGDPSSLTDGDVWYNSSSNGLFARINGVTVELGAVTIDHVVMGDGANPPSPLNDGNGNFIYIPYTP